MDVFAVLADPTRRRLLTQIADRPHSAGELAADEPMSRPAVSKHLRLLREAGVVDVEIDGRFRRYRLRREPLDDVRRFLDALEKAPIGSEAFDALDLEVRRTARERATTPQRREESA